MSNRTEQNETSFQELWKLYFNESLKIMTIEEAQDSAWDFLEKDLNTEIKKAELRGRIEGIREYAWWKDGKEYVGQQRPDGKGDHVLNEEIEKAKKELSGL